jgi:hypothetical protein
MPLDDRGGHSPFEVVDAPSDRRRRLSLTLPASSASLSLFCSSTRARHTLLSHRRDGVRPPPDHPDRAVVIACARRLRLQSGFRRRILVPFVPLVGDGPPDTDGLAPASLSTRVRDGRRGGAAAAKGCQGARRPGAQVGRRLRRRCAGHDRKLGIPARAHARPLAAGTSIRLLDCALLALGLIVFTFTRANLQLKDYLISVRCVILVVGRPRPRHLHLATGTD